jgi:hypothetical protein
MFHGAGCGLPGYLMFRAAFLPRFVGVLMTITGVGFVTSTFVWILAPTYTSPILLLPAAFSALAMTLWFIMKGVDVPQPEALAAAAPHRSL